MPGKLKPCHEERETHFGENTEKNVEIFYLNQSVFNKLVSWKCDSIFSFHLIFGFFLWGLDAGEGGGNIAVVFLFSSLH